MRVVYLHGFASSPASRKARFFGEKFAARGMPFLAPSLDQGNFPEMTITGEMQLVQDLLRETPEPVTLIGSSLGGYVASLIAARQPAAVERLILLRPLSGYTNAGANNSPRARSRAGGMRSR